MSNRAKTWVAGLVGVAVGAALAATIFLVNQPPAAREQATGAIGAAVRERTEQIKEGDTGITGEQAATTAGTVTIEQLADLLGKAAPEVSAKGFRALESAKQVEMLGRAPAEAVASMLDLADMAVKVQAASRATPEQRVNWALKLPEEARRAMLARTNPAVAERFVSLSREQQQAAMQNLSARDQVALMEHATPLEKHALARELPLESRNLMLKHATDEQCARILALGSKDDRVMAFRAMPTADQARLFDTASSQMRETFLGRVPFDQELADQLARVMTVREKAESLAYGKTDQVAEALGRLDNAVLARVTAQASDAERVSAMKSVDEAQLARAWQNLKFDAQLAAFANLSAQEKLAAFAAMNAKEAQWEKMTPAAQAERFANMDARMQAKMFTACDQRQHLEAFNALQARHQFEALRASGLSERVIKRCDSSVKAAAFDAAPLEVKAQCFRADPNMSWRKMIERFPDQARYETFQRALNRKVSD